MARERGEYELAWATVHNFCSKFEQDFPIAKLLVALETAKDVEQFVMSKTALADAADEKAVLKEEEAFAMEARVESAKVALEGIADESQRRRAVAETDLGEILKIRESGIMGSVKARVTLAENAAKVLEARIAGLEAQETRLNQFILERRAVLDDVNQKIAEFYKSLPERETG